MDIASLIGVITLATVFSTSVYFATSTPLIFLDIASIIIVIGGTIGAVSVSFSAKQLITMMKLSVNIFHKPPEGLFDLVREIVQIAESAAKDPSFLPTYKSKIRHPLLKTGVNLYIEGLNKKEIMEFLTERLEAEINRDLDDASYFKVASKYPPAFGMIGTLIGLVAMLNAMGADTSVETLGPSMSIALITTFFGSVVANMILLPIYECLASRAVAAATENNTALKGVEFILQKDNPFVIQEKLHSYLAENQRENFLAGS